MLCNAELNSFDSSYLTQLTLGAPHAQVNFSIHIIRIFNFKMIIFLMQAEYLHLSQLLLLAVALDTYFQIKSVL